MLRLLAGVLAFLIPFGLHTGFILNQFYRSGAVFFDAGLYASLIWRNGFSLPMPDQDLPYILDGSSYYRIHFTLLLGLLSVLSEVIPLDRVHFFAGYIGLCFGVLSLSIYWVLSWGFPRAGPWVGLLLALLYSQSGLAIAIARYPHTEVMAVGLLVFFFGFVLRQRYAAASLFLTLALTVREDCGCHAAAILGLLWLDERWRQKKPWRDSLPLLLFASAGVLWTLLAVAVQACFFAGGDALLRTYAGGLQENNLAVILRQRIHLWLPVMATLVSGFALGSRRQLLALLAFVPWLLLHLAGSRMEPATLVAYYGYPFLLSFAWILLAQVTPPRGETPVIRPPSVPPRGETPVIRPPSVPPRGETPGGEVITLRRQTQSMVAFGLVCLLSLLGLSLQNESARGFFEEAWPSVLSWNGGGVENFLSEWKRAGLAREGVYVDTAVLSLAPWDFPAGSWFEKRPPQGKVEAVLFFARRTDFSHTLSHVACLARPTLYQVRGTRMWLAAAEDFLIPDSLRGRLSAVPLLQATHEKRLGRPHGTGFAMRSDEGPGAFLVLACGNMRPGRYECRYRYHLLQPSAAGELVVKVWVDHGQRCAFERTFPLQAEGALSWSFEVDTDNQKFVEFVLHEPSQGEICIDDCEIRLDI